MADNIWNNSDADNDGNNPNNYSLVRVPTTGDTMLFDNTSDANCTFSGNISCDAINVTSVYDGDIDFNDFDISTTGNETYDGTGELKRGTGTNTCGGNFDDKDQGTVTSESSTVVLNGTAKNLISSSSRSFWNLTIDGSITLDAATFSRAQVLNDLVVNGGKSFTLNENFRLLDAAVAATATNNGTIDGAQPFSMRGVGSILNQNGIFTAPLEVQNGSQISGGTYGGTVLLEQHSGIRTSTLGTAGGQTLTFQGAVTIQSDTPSTHRIDLSTHNPDLVFQDDVTLQELSGTLVWDKGTGINSITGAANLSLDFNNKAIEDLVINKTAGDVTLTGWIQTDSFTGTSTGTGSFDPNGQTIAVAGNCDWAAAFLFNLDADSMDGCMWTVGGNWTADGQTLNAVAPWYLQVDGTAVASGTGEVEYCDGSGYTKIDASTGPWVNGGNNSNWNFGVIINQLQGANLGADLYNGALAI